MAITLEANYSKKLGLRGYSSHQYMLTIRTELNDLTQIDAESKRLHGLLQGAVDRELQQTGWLPEPINGNGNGKPRTAALYVGNIVHGILKQWNMARWRKQSMPVEQLKLLFNQLWLTDQKKELIRWAKDEETGEQSTAWSLLNLYFKETPIPPNETPEGVEVPLEADLTNHGLPKLIGIVDLVRAGGRIVDYKTIGQSPNEDKAIHLNELQLSCYSVLYRESTGRNESGRDLHQLVKTKTPKLIVTQQGPMSDQQQTRLFKQIESYVEGVGRNDFIPSPGLQCSACRFLPECRRWG